MKALSQHNPPTLDLARGSCPPSLVNTARILASRSEFRAALSRRLLRWLYPLLATAVLALGACGGGAGATETASAPPPQPTAITLRTLAPDFFSRKAVAYSGYRGADHVTPPTDAQVLEDLQLLVQGRYGLIRMFGADDADTGVVLRTIKANKLDLKMQLGIWISGTKAAADAANQSQIAKGVALAKAYPDIVLAVSVGNETMVDWSQHLPAADMAGYIRQVRSAITQPVTTDDNWAVFANQGNKYDIAKVLAEIDFASMHTYPLLDSVYDPAFKGWQHGDLPEAQRAAAMMDTFFAKAKADYAAVRSYLDANGHASMPVTIGETGWKAFGPQADRIHPANQKLYLDRLNAWTGGPKQVFWFEAFDEPWKGDDDGWGLFDVHRKARTLVQPLYPAAQQDGTHFIDADAVYWKP